MNPSSLLDAIAAAGNDFILAACAILRERNPELLASVDRALGNGARLQVAIMPAEPAVVVLTVVGGDQAIPVLRLARDEFSVN